MTSGRAGVDERLDAMLREEWEALGLMSYHGGIDNGIWFADLGPDDIGKIRALLHEAAAELVSLKDALSVEGLFFKIEYRQGAPGAYVVVYGQGERLASPEEVAMWQRLSKASDAAAREALGMLP